MIKIGEANAGASLNFPTDLFDWALKLGLLKPPTKTVLCLDCSKVELTLHLNEQKQIYEGRRLCKCCRQLQKRKYLGV